MRGTVEEVRYSWWLLWFSGYSSWQNNVWSHQKKKIALATGGFGGSGRDGQDGKYQALLVSDVNAMVHVAILTMQRMFFKSIGTLFLQAGDSVFLWKLAEDKVPWVEGNKEGSKGVCSISKSDDSSLED
jgi:hypothetical protein